MNIEEVLKQIADQAGTVDPIGATLKIILDGHIIYVDGTGDTNIITGDDKEASCVITTSVDTLKKLKSGDLNPMMAAMSGKVKIKGDMSLAMKLQSLLT